MRRTRVAHVLVGVLTLAGLLSARTAPALADGGGYVAVAGGEVMFTADDGTGYYMHAAAGVLASGATSVLAEMWVYSPPVTCPDGTQDTDMRLYHGEAPGTADIAKQATSATATATLDLDAFGYAACTGTALPVAPMPSTPVALDLVGVGTAIHSLKLSVDKVAGKVNQHTVTHETLRFAEGALVIGAMRHTVTRETSDIEIYGPGHSAVTGPLDSVAAAPGSLADAGVPPQKTVLKTKGVEAVGESHVFRDDAPPGGYLARESAVTAFQIDGHPAWIDAGEHTIRVVECGGTPSTVETYVTGGGDATLDVAPNLDGASASARLSLVVDTYDACTDTSTERVAADVPVRLDVTATGTRQNARTIWFDHEGGWASESHRSTTVTRDGAGVLVIGSLSQAFDVGGIARWTAQTRFVSHAGHVAEA